MPFGYGIGNPDDFYRIYQKFNKGETVSNFEIKSGPGYTLSGSPITEEVTATVINSSSTEPVRAVASVATIAVAVAMGILQLIAPDWVDAASIIIAILTPVVMAIFTRGKVWSPASVRAVIEEALKAAEQAKKR